MRQQLRRKFDKMMRALYRQQGAQLDISILAEDEVQQFIDTHADALNGSFQKVEMSDAMRSRLERSNWVFSGMKTFHELGESFPSLLDPDGNRKPFERFLNDVRAVDETYNANYLRSEYNFIHASASMAAKWEQYAEDGDRYNLQYRTAGDDRVRPEHAALDGVTLPMDDPFWEEFYPPNGWNCRCTVVQVRKSKYPVTPSDEAMRLGQLATGQDTKGMFHFNPGKQQKAVPDYNPYTIRQCRTCPTAKGDGKASLASEGIPNTQLCEACRFFRECAGDREKSQSAIARKHYIDKEMASLLRSKVVKEIKGGKAIKATFDKKGNKHLYSDAISRTRRLPLDELKNMDDILRRATFISDSEKDPSHNNPYDHFYYFKTDINGKGIRINVGKKVEDRKNSKPFVRYICYSVNDYNE